MVSIQNDSILLPEFPGIQSSVTVSPTAWSFPHCIGYSILKVLIRSKCVEPVHESLKRKILEVLEYCTKTFSSSESLGYIETFSSIVKLVSEQQNPKQCHEWLEYWFSPDQSLTSILYSSYYILSYLALQQNRAIDEILDDDPLSILECFSKTFSIYTKLIWESGNYLYEAPSNEQGFVVYLYYRSDTKILSYLKHQNEKDIEENFVGKNEFTQLFMYNYSSDQGFFMKSFKTSAPLLFNLVSLMTKTLADNNIYSAELDQALKSAIEESPDLMKVPIIKSVFEFKRPACTLHPDAVYIELSCKSQHCSHCIYRKIKQDYSKLTKSLFCDCKVQISPKLVDSLKSTEEFKEYFRKF